MLNKKRNIHKKIQRKTFLSLLYDILNDSAYNEFISWNSKGNGIIIFNINKLSEIVLPKYFKHNKYTSFVRQLNIYGFYKAKGIQKEGERFQHDKFNINMSKEEINEISRQYNNQKFFLYTPQENIKKDLNDTETQSSSNNENNLLKNILDILIENNKALINLKNDAHNLIAQNEILNAKFDLLKNNIYVNNILLQKILTKNKDNINIFCPQNEEKSKCAKNLLNVEKDNKFIAHKEMNIELNDERLISFPFNDENNFKGFSNINLNDISFNKDLILEENSKKIELNTEINFFSVNSSNQLFCDD